MTEFTMDRLRENLEALNMKNTLEILDNYLERAVAEDLNIVEVLDHIFSEEAKSKRRRAYEKQIQMSGFPIKKTLDDFDFSFQPSIDKRQIDELATMRFLENGENVVFLGPPGVGKTHLASALGLVAAQHRFSTYYINCHQLIEQLKKAHFENRLPDKLKVLAKYRMLIIDEIGYLPMDIQGANLFFQLIARRYEKTSTVFTSNKTFSQWNEVFADVTIASAILDRVLHHCTVINIKGESYRLKERKEFMRQLGITQEKTLQRYIDKKGNQKIIAGNVDAISKGLFGMLNQSKEISVDSVAIQTILKAAKGLDDNNAKAFIMALAGMVRGG